MGIVLGKGYSDSVDSISQKGASYVQYLEKPDLLPLFHRRRIRYDCQPVRGLLVCLLRLHLLQDLQK